MFDKVATGVLTLITAAVVSGVFMMPLLLIMEWIGLSLSGWWVFLIVFVIVLIQWGPITKAKAEDRMMWV